MSSRIPVKTLKVLGREYRITDNAKASKAMEFDPENDDGIHCSTKMRILIAANPKPVKQRVLLHELIHAVEDALGIKIDHDDIDRLAVALHAVFQDNPEYAQWQISK